MNSNVLPADTGALQAQLTTVSAQLQQALDEVRDLRRQLDWFKRQVFGSKSERLLADPADQSDMLVALGQL